LKKTLPARSLPGWVTPLRKCSNRTEQSYLGAERHRAV
jgi:hypothetical protein